MMTRNQTYLLLAGMCVGAGAAMLLAPQSGEATRKSLRDGLDEAGERLSGAGEYLRMQADHFNAEAQATIDHARSQVLDVVEHASSTVNATLGEVSRTFAATIEQASSAIVSAVEAATGKLQ